MRDYRRASSYAALNGKSILITGGTGSFGQRFIEKILSEAAPARVVVFSRDEFKQFEMQQNLAFGRHPALRYFIGDVRDADRLDLAMRGIDTVVHAAALKHVPAAEYNPFECIRTNVHGAENVVRAALRAKVGRVLALSTDKAVNPINLYGASKLAADKIFIAANHLSGNDDVRFSVVRYGNVIGSRGSVVPMFRRLLAEGATELPVTDERMTRFWITLTQGVDFVVDCLATMKGSEILVPKIPSMRITDLARAMAPGLPLRTIGIRPGEKLHEALITRDDARLTLELEDRYIVKPSFAMWDPSIDYGGKPVPEDFHYESGDNAEWLDADGLNTLFDKGHI
ncbi:UDP-N-acetylglucosamine 4,6-dehydratase [Azospirillum fermentarium]|uniref:UDP-N-acetylglucosamine 4,6-dehydratase (inverting) n=1 Tax=Azospirillum fermentarium TaxID=1233114 RepID=UPI002227A230|nr:UDP-N-acetylglucosamine 4,6-dehydratase (inverting) [Azospirillum fermentarium]MCW2249515.1 UDP-N-acetylglucosamine 4,6-dehydratase [Azospirillum fermentarium]